MEVQYKTGNGQFAVNFDVKDSKALFESVADFQEVFEHNGDYSINGEDVPSSDVQFRVREVGGNKYYEKVYVGTNKNCWGFKLQYGQNKVGGGLFPKYYHEKDNDYVDGGNGWRKYKGEKGAEVKSDDATGDAPAKADKTKKAPF